MGCSSFLCLQAEKLGRLALTVSFSVFIGVKVGFNGKLDLAMGFWVFLLCPLCDRNLYRMKIFLSRCLIA